MAFVVQYQTIPANGSASFNISDTVSGYILGISNFSFTYGNHDHHVQELKLSLDSPGISSPGQSASTPTEILVTANATLSDASGHHIDAANSSVTVVMLAWTGSDNPQFTLGSATIVNGQSSNMTVPVNTPVSGLQPMVSGFDLAYPSGVDHDVQLVDIGISVSNQNTGSASLGATASMNDASGHHANGAGGTTATINGSLLATSLSSPGFVKQLLLPLQTTNSHVVEFGVQLDSAVVLITGFQLQYPGSHTDHWVKTIGAGPTGWRINGSQVSLDNAQAFMSDNSHHSQDNTASNVTLVVIGIPS
jgi:hypothetical protein